MTVISQSYTISGWGLEWFWLKKASHSFGGSSRASGRSSEDAEAKVPFGWEEYVAADALEALSTSASSAARRLD